MAAWNIRTRRIGAIAVSFILLSLCARSNTVFSGGSITSPANWDNGLPSSTNQGIVGVDGFINIDVQGYDVIQTGGVITISSGLVGQAELRSTSWRLDGGIFRRTNTALQIGAGSLEPSWFHVSGGVLSVTAPGESLIVRAGDSLLRITGGMVSAQGTLRIDWKASHVDGPFLEFGPGAGTATFSGLELGPMGYVNFVSGSEGVLILTEGTITDNLHGTLDTFWEMWEAGRLRIDGANEGAFNNQFSLSQSGPMQTLRLNSGAGTRPAITGFEEFGGAIEMIWSVETNRWIIERAETIAELSSNPVLADHSSGVPTNAVLLIAGAENEFFRILTGLQVLSGFTDSNLVSAIKQIGLNSLGPDSHVYDLDVLGLTALQADDAGVASVAGVENLSGVLYLDLRDNPIIDINPLGGMTQLQGVDLQGTSLEDPGALGTLTNLVWVGLSDNLITNLTGLAPLTGIAGFDLSGNLITNLSAMASVSHATRLNLIGNGISDLSGIEVMSGLEYLNLHSNAVSDISPISNLTSLGWLDLSENLVSNLTPLAGLTNLSWVGFSDNALTNTTGLSASIEIEWLGLQNNRIEDLGGLGSLTNLTWLNLAGNSVSNLGALATLSNLRVLDVQSNNVTTLTGLEGLSKLDWLGVSGNSISNLSPLVVNASLGGLSTGCVVYAGGNPLSDFALTNQIPTLSNTYGVIVYQD